MEKSQSTIRRQENFPRRAAERGGPPHYRSANSSAATRLEPQRAPPQREAAAYGPRLQDKRQRSDPVPASRWRSSFGGGEVQRVARIKAPPSPGGRKGFHLLDSPEAVNFSEQLEHFSHLLQFCSWRNASRLLLRITLHNHQHTMHLNVHWQGGARVRLQVMWPKTYR